MKRNEAFNSIAELYDEVRPSYPDKLISDIIDNTKINSESRLLEIGPGTGKATIKLAEKGFKIHGVELSENMAKLLREKCTNYPKVEVEVASFEKWQPKNDEKYQVIYCAQAFHWIDKALSYKKCNELLEEGGYLALFWYQPVAEKSELKEEIDSIISKYESKSKTNSEEEHSASQLTEMRKKELESSGFFKDVKVFEYIIEKSMNAAEYIKVINSYSGFVVLEEAVRLSLDKEVEQAINRHGGEITSSLNYSLFLGKRI